MNFTVDHIAISVTDLEESANFYRDVVGLKQIEEPFKQNKHAWFQVGRVQLHVIKASEARQHRDKSNHLCFSVDDLDAFMMKLEKYAIVYSDFPGNEGAVNIRPDGIRQIFFQDPDGYWLEVNDVPL